MIVRNGAPLPFNNIKSGQELAERAEQTSGGKAKFRWQRKA